MENQPLAAGNLSLNTLEEIIRKMGGEKIALAFLRGELMLTKSNRIWTEEKEAFYLTVISDGASPGQGLQSLEEKDFSVQDNARKILNSNEYVPTCKIAYKIAIFKGSFFKEGFRNLRHQRNKARLNELYRPTLEIARLLREALSDEDLKAMELWTVIICHMPAMLGVKEYVCSIRRDGSGGVIQADEIDSNHEFGIDTGFAFIVSANPVLG